MTRKRIGDESINNSGVIMTKEISDLKSRVTKIEKFKEKTEEFNHTCEEKHNQHSQHRRQSDDKMVGVYAVLTEMRDTIREIAKDYKEDRETIKRSKDNYTTVDTVLKWCGMVTVMSAAVVIVYHAVKFLQGVL